MINLSYKLTFGSIEIAPRNVKNSRVLSKDLNQAYLGRSPQKSSVKLYQTLSDYFFSPGHSGLSTKNSKWYSMEEIITHFLFYSEGPVLPSGFSNGGVEAPKGHLGVSMVSTGGNKVTRARIRSSILVMAGQLNSIVQGVSLGDFVVIVSGSNIVIGEVDR